MGSVVMAVALDDCSLILIVWLSSFDLALPGDVAYASGCSVSVAVVPILYLESSSFVIEDWTY